MKIGICDDMKEMRLILHRILEKHISTPFVMEISEYASALDLLQQAPDLDLLFLDIEMPGMSGMELLKKHGSLFAHTKVVLLTSHTDYLLEGYEVNVYRYLIKPVQIEKLNELFASLSKEEVLQNNFSFFANGLMTTLPFSDIIYFRTDNNVTTISTVQHSYKVYQTLKEIEPLLPTQFFFRTHRSYIVNLEYVTGISPQRDTVLLSNGEEAYLSKRKKADFEKKYLEVFF